jgi:hypothetical protein
MIDSGPFIVANLRGRVESLTNALDRAQERIDDLEKAFGSEAELMPLLQMGLSPSEARIVRLVSTRDIATAKQVMFAIYAEDPDQINEIDAYPTMKTFISHARNKLARFGLAIETIGWGREASGYRMSGPDKARLAKLIASGARLVTRGRPDRKYYRKAAHVRVDPERSCLPGVRKQAQLNRQIQNG